MFGNHQKYPENDEEYEGAEENVTHNKHDHFFRGLIEANAFRGKLVHVFVNESAEKTRYQRRIFRT